MRAMNHLQAKLRLSSVERLGSLARRLPPHKYTLHLDRCFCARQWCLRWWVCGGILYDGEGRSFVSPSRSKVNFTRHVELLALRAHYRCLVLCWGLLASLDFSGWIRARRPLPRAVMRPSWVTLTCGAVRGVACAGLVRRRVRNVPGRVGALRVRSYDWASMVNDAAECVGVQESSDAVDAG